MQKIPRVIGTGWALPEKIRYNDDPIFDWLKEHFPNQPLFKGYNTRYILEKAEDLIQLMVIAGKKALENAKVLASDIDIVLGIGSISPFIEPNLLSQVHKELGLPPKAYVIPVGNDFSNFGSSLLLATSLVECGRATNVLICIGGNWSANVDYHTIQSISAGDGAGAGVVSLSEDSQKWYLVDQCTVTDSDYYGSMFTQGIPLELGAPVMGYSQVFSPSFFQITDRGVQGFKEFGTQIALGAVQDLLKRNNLTGEDISFIPHQSSEVLIDYWVSKLTPPPAQVLNNIAKFANQTVATHAFNLAWLEENGTFEKNNLVMLALGPDMHANALLLRRGL